MSYEHKKRDEQYLTVQMIKKRFQFENYFAIH